MTAYSTVRYKKGNYGDIYETAPTNRRATLSRQDHHLLNRLTRTMQDDRDKNTYDDTEVTPSLRPGRSTRTTQASTRNRYEPDGYSRQRGKHPLFYIGVGMLIVILGWTAIYMIVVNWTLHISDNNTYGPNRISVLISEFGHNDSQERPTWLEAFNYKGQAIIIELPGGDSTKAHIYPGPKLYDIDGVSNPQTTIVTIKAVDLNHDGLKDIEVNVLTDQFDITLKRASIQYKLLNTGKAFKPA